MTKVGARRGDDDSWLPAVSPAELTSAVHDNLRNLGLDALDVVNLRVMGGGAGHGPSEGSIEEPLAALAELQRRGLIRELGLSNVTPAQIAQGRAIVEVACVQNEYNLAHRADDALVDALAADGIAYVPFFRSAVSRHCNRRRFPASRRGSTRRPCRSRWRGSSTARRTCC